MQNDRPAQSHCHHKFHSLSVSRTPREICAQEEFNLISGAFKGQQLDALFLRRVSELSDVKASALSNWTEDDKGRWLAKLARCDGYRLGLLEGLIPVVRQPLRYTTEALIQAQDSVGDGPVPEVILTINSYLEKCPHEHVNVIYLFLGGYTDDDTVARLTARTNIMGYMSARAIMTRVEVLNSIERCMVIDGIRYRE